MLKISYETLDRLADKVTLDDQRRVSIYSMGRGGSTWTASAFSQVEDVVSLSEPDVLSQWVRIRGFSGTNDVGVGALTRACLLLTCKDGGNGQLPIWVLKFRSFVMGIADSVTAHFPHARSLFLYRLADLWGKSMARALGGNEPPTREEFIAFWM